MPTVISLYKGGLRCASTHLQSNAELVTDAPTDNQGKGSSFSPTDLVATALGTCIMTIMGAYANKNNLDFEGMKMEITKTMQSEPRRIKKSTFSSPCLKSNYPPFKKLIWKPSPVPVPFASA